MLYILRIPTLILCLMRCQIVFAVLFRLLFGLFVVVVQVVDQIDHHGTDLESVGLVVTHLSATFFARVKLGLRHL